LILIEANAGEIIFDFGNLVVGGNFIVGAAVFLVLTVIQFLVIAKGADRAAEVAARFTLDAMAGKQMAIDADLERGRIKPDEARVKRGELETENTLFAAMSGATKFVQGDAIAGLIILGVNIVGGLTIGVLDRGMPLADAARLYTILTIGDGLVSQIPALVISLAAAIIITRVSAEQQSGKVPGLGGDLLGQLLDHPQALFVVGGTMGALALAIGPWYVFVGLGILCGVGGWYARRIKSDEKATAAQVAAARVSETMGVSEGVPSPLAMPAGGTPKVGPAGEASPRVRLFISRTLEPLVYPEAQEARQAVEDRLRQARHSLQEMWGFEFPVVSFMRERAGVPQLPPSSFQILFGGVRLDMAVVPIRLIACARQSELEAAGLQATPFQHHWLGVEHGLIDVEQAELARQRKFDIKTPLDYVMDGLGFTLARHAAEFCGVQEIANRVEGLRETSKDLVESVVDRMFSLPEIAEVSSRLLRERIPIRDFRLVLEALSRWRGKVNDPLLVTEHVRGHMRLLLTGLYSHPFGRIVHLNLSGIAERALQKAYEPDGIRGPAIGLAEEEILGLRQSIGAGLQRARKQFPGCRPVLLVRPSLRYAARLAVQGDFPELPVLARDEIAPGFRLDFVGAVSTEPAPTAAVS
jgi:type III secretion protein V